MTIWNFFSDIYHLSFSFFCEIYYYIFGSKMPETSPLLKNNPSNSPKNDFQFKKITNTKQHGIKKESF